MSAKIVKVSHGHRADGDVRHRIDFRRVYAALLRNWLGVPPAAILGGEYEPLDLIHKHG